MKDLSFLLLKNLLGAKMKKKGLSNFCNGDCSTSTLNQKPNATLPSLDTTGSFFDDTDFSGKTPTLEEMIIQLELEEAEAMKKKKKKLGDNTDLRRRMSCVNNYDVLKSARNALNQYPRFSLDGRDAMYRSSFRNSTAMAGVHEGRRKSVCSGSGLRGRLSRSDFNEDFRSLTLLPPTVSGDSVVWCKPGVVAKLMGLDSMPVPISRRYASSKTRPSCKTRRQNLRRVERAETEKKKLGMSVNGCRGMEKDNRISSSSIGYRLVMNPTSSELCDGEEKSWSMGRMRY